MLPVLLRGIAVRGVDVDVGVGEARHEGAPAEVERLDPAGQRPHPARRDDVHDALAVHHDGGAVDRLFTVGFCLGGRASLVQAARPELGLAGVIGFYGFPTGAHRTGTPAPADLATSFTCPVLAIFGGADQAIPAEARDAFDNALTGAGIEHRIVVYEGAPHSFFDRKATEYADASADSWRQVLAFMGVGEPGT